MITAGKALLIASMVAAQQGAQAPWVGNVTVEPVGGIYRVLFVAMVPSPAPAPSALLVIVERASGRVTKIENAPVTIASLTPPVSIPGAVIPATKAYETAVAALQGHENYDKEGRVTVQLKTDRYEVTFPLPSTQAGGRGPDYAYQIWVDPWSGAVTKILVAS